MVSPFVEVRKVVGYAPGTVGPGGVVVEKEAVESVLSEFAEEAEFDDVEEDAAEGEDREGGADFECAPAVEDVYEGIFDSSLEEEGNDHVDEREGGLLCSRWWSGGGGGAWRER